MGDSAVATLNRLAQLPAGWDSHGGRPMHPLSLDVARIITTEPPSIVPGSSGSIHLEWHTGSWDIEIEIRADDAGGVSIEWLVVRLRDGQEIVRGSDEEDPHGGG